MPWGSVVFDAEDSRREFWVLHNSAVFSEALSHYSVFDGAFDRCGWPCSFVNFLGRTLADVFSRWSSSQLPVAPSLQHNWILDALRNSTRGLKRPGFAADAAAHVLRILNTMKSGEEILHLNGLVNLVDMRGSDVRLDTGSICESSRQAVPYPAVAWNWRCVQSYAWRSTQHINVLELIAFLNYYKCMSA